MSLAQPLALGLALLAIPVVLAFLERRRAVTRSVSSLRIYRVLAASQAASASSRRLRDLLALLLVLLALVGLVAALAGPSLDKYASHTTIVVLDTSASMGALEPGQRQTRHARAVDALAAHLRALPDGDRVALVAAGPTATLLVGPTADHERVLDAARATRPSGRSTGDPAALRLAAALCRDANTSLLGVTDGWTADWPNTDCPVHQLGVGEAAANVGITGFTARQADGLGLVEVHVAVEGTPGSTVRVRLEGGDRLLDVIALEVPGERVVQVDRGDADALRAILELDGPDALAADDVAIAVLAGAAPVRTLLVTDAEPSYLAEALRLHPRVDLVVAPPDAVPGGTWDLALLEAEPAGPLPSARRIAAFGTDPTRFGVPSLGAARLPRDPVATSEDPLLRYVTVDGLRVTSTRLLGLPDGATALVRVEGGPIAVRLPHDGGEALVLGFRPSDSDLVLRVGFVNLVANLVEEATPAVAPVGPSASLLSAHETRLGPAAPGVLPPGAPGPASPWRLLVLLAVAALALEWGLPALRRARHRIDTPRMAL